MNRNKFLRLSNSGIQMGVIIGGLALLGDYIDNQYVNSTPIWTIVLSLLGVGLGLFIVIREVIKISKADD